MTLIYFNVVSMTEQRVCIYLTSDSLTMDLFVYS